MTRIRILSGYLPVNYSLLLANPSYTIRIRFLVALLLTLFVFYYVFRIAPAVDSSEPEVVLSRPLNKKYVVYECRKACAGWADRLKAIMSAYAWALLTNRTLLLSMNRPCPIEKMYQLNQVDWFTDLKFIQPELDKRESWFDKPKIKIVDRMVNYGLGDYNQLKSENIMEYEPDADVITINTGIMFMNAFGYNDHLKGKIRQLGYDPARFTVQYMLYEWYKQLFTLHPAQEKEYQRFIQQTRKREGYKLICAQLRVRGNIVTDFRGRKLEAVKKKTNEAYWNFINDTFLSKLPDKDKYMIYVTSDSEQAKKSAIDHFGADRVITFEDSGHYFIDFNYIFDNCKNILKVILDFHVQQECDMGVVGHSGFGLLGLWNRPDPAKDLYVYSTEHFIRTGVFTNKNLTFIQLQGELLDVFNFKI